MAIAAQPHCGAGQDVVFSGRSRNGTPPAGRRGQQHWTGTWLDRTGTKRRPGPKPANHSSWNQCDFDTKPLFVSSAGYSAVRPAPWWPCRVVVEVTLIDLADLFRNTLGFKSRVKRSQDRQKCSHDRHECSTLVGWFMDWRRGLMPDESCFLLPFFPSSWKDALICTDLHCHRNGTHPRPWLLLLLHLGALDLHHLVQPASLSGILFWN